MKHSGTCYQLHLQRGVNYKGSLFHVRKGDTIRFTAGTTLQGLSISFFTNHPDAPDKPFSRTDFRSIPFKNPSPFKLDTFDTFAELAVVQAGSFNFHVCGEKESEKITQGYILVDPELHDYPLTGLTIQTYLTKSLGKLEDWLSRLEVAAVAGYNVVHLTPIQKLGKSQSSYCLQDQLGVNPAFGSPEVPASLAEVEKVVKTMQSKWGVLCITDLVFNHTANESPWLQEHPECAFNLVNSPHLRPAYLLDRIVWQLTLDIAAGRLEPDGIHDSITDHWQLSKLGNYLWQKLHEFRLHEFFMVHIDDAVDEFRHFLNKEVKGSGDKGSVEDVVLRIKPRRYQRLKGRVSFKDAALIFYWNRPGGPGRLEAACGEFRICLQRLNDEKYHLVQSHLQAAIGNILANAEYRFLNPEGPCYGRPVSDDYPIMWTYFLHPDDDVQLDGAETLMDSKRAAWVMAHNGWVMNDDPLHNFAAETSNVYLRRELIPWGDSVKLNYGDSPKSNPYLWDLMTRYTENTARIFHGGRLDNCHSTPLNVAQFMMDKARAIRPDFYVIAELFTRQESVDNIFINKLGITALIREAMSAGDSHEEGRLVYRFGGIPVGSFSQPQCRPLMPGVARAVFYDVTHDNPSMVEHRSPFDLLPSSALVLWADCAAGSTRGFDEAVPHNVDVVTEIRPYARWGTEVDDKTALLGAKASLNKLHQWLAMQGFTEVFVDQVSYDVVTVTRHCPKDRRSAILVVHTAFHPPQSDAPSTTRPLPIEGDIVEILFEGSTSVEDADFSRDDLFINGMSGVQVSHQSHIPVSSSRVVSSSSHGDELMFVNFPPGSAVAVLVKPSEKAEAALKTLDASAQDWGFLQSAMSELSPVDLNWLLYRCDPEERVSVHNGGVYHVPGHGDLNYAGLQGVMSLLADIRPHNDLGHPLCDNLRRGDWYGGYMCARLLKNEGTKRLGSWMLDNLVRPLSSIPHYLKPCYFDLVLTAIYTAALESSWQSMGVLKASSLARGLAMCSFQFSGVVANATLPPLSKKLQASPSTKSRGRAGLLYRWRRLSASEKDGGVEPTLAAGFPHFSEGIWRNWGRDTFISLPGLLLCCSRWDEARHLILGYAGCLRHGLIPNLLGTAFVEEHGVGPRYNARDAVWFWLVAIRSYVDRAPDGSHILSDPVLRMFPRHVEERGYALSRLLDGAKEQPLEDVIQECLERHASADIDFVEWGAGPGLDDHMDSEGFHVSACIDWRMGFPVGGNAKNCGTWMDKMGSSDWANNRGNPGTPRDGSAVELVGLCYATVSFLKRMHAEGKYRHAAVTRPDGRSVTWAEWQDLLVRNYEERFWIPYDTEDPSLRTNRGVYRDSVGSANKFTDNQFRPNFLVTMAIAPELFTASKAWRALRRVGSEMLGPLGIRTLHPADFAYRGHYDNSDDSADYHVAHGFNYHQGPEWLWPVGFYLRAVLHFSRCQEDAEKQAAIQHVQAVLGRHQEALLNSHWRSLPELTNANGQHCAHSCMAQAWSAGCLMEALNDLLLLSSSE